MLGVWPPFVVHVTVYGEPSEVKMPLAPVPALTQNCVPAGRVSVAPKLSSTSVLVPPEGQCCVTALAVGAPYRMQTVNTPSARTINLRTMALLSPGGSGVDPGGNTLGQTGQDVVPRMAHVASIVRRYVRA